MSRVNWKILLAMVVVLWFQMGVLSLFSFGTIIFDFSLLYLAFLSFTFEYRRVLIFAFVAGCLKDLLTGAFFGLETVSLICGTLLLRQIIAQFDRRDEWVQGWGTFLFAFFTLLVHAGLLALVQERYVLNVSTWFKSVLIAGGTSVLVIFIFPIFKRLLETQSALKQYELFKAN
ncbi:MAG: hypothetical protein HY582_03970 [Candidatus Omnitrophica bacterium]|nr:hypothetical protein [Candidatus Omnitrophota bacterium]